MSPDDPSTPAAFDAWAKLRAHTQARIGLARSGVSISSGAVLELRAAHAAARDAVWTPLELAPLAKALAAHSRQAVEIASQASDRRTYLMRPDLGRRLTPESASRLKEICDACDLVIVLADGLSPTAVQRHAAPLLAALLPFLGETWRLAPPVLAQQARVALGDEIALALGATGVLMLIGERPGLSATDSLGAYLTWDVKPGMTDADRNCVSNIRLEGVTYELAARQIAYLLVAAREGGYSGVALKNRIDAAIAAPD